MKLKDGMILYHGCLLYTSNREFWCKGYYVDTVGKNTTAIKEYIANQLERDSNQGYGRGEA